MLDTNALAQTPGVSKAVPIASPAIRRVTIEQSTLWLSQGWKDFCDHPGLSITMGGIFTLCGYILLFGLTWVDLGSLFLPLAAGFLLLGPLSAVVLYEVSRHNEQGLPCELSAVLRTIWSRIDEIAQLGFVLVFIQLIWMLSAALVFAMFFSGAPPSLDEMLTEIVASQASLPFLLLGTAVGGFLAAVTFAVSVISMPMLMDRDVAVGQAISLSVQATLMNWPTMIGWAMTIAVVSFTGMLFGLLGLIVVLPVLGYASWHAYRDIIEPAKV